MISGCGVGFNLKAAAAVMTDPHPFFLPLKYIIRIIEDLPVARLYITMLTGLKP